jgi:hypothetical protein
MSKLNARLDRFTYWEMAALVRSIRREVKKRNPIFVNAYIPLLDGAVAALEEISAGEMKNFTSESGPRESKK